MRFSKPVGAALCAAGLLGIAGCPLQESRLTNQGGGNILSATGKIVSGTLSQLTPDEIQILADRVSTTLADLNNETEPVELSDEQAQVVADFFSQNNVGSVSDLNGLIAQAEEDPGSIVIPEGVTDLSDAGGFDEG
jgi:hypothetical protein